MAPNEGVQYVGFWARVLAALIDSVLILPVVAPLLYWFYGPAYFAPMLDFALRPRVLRRCGAVQSCRVPA
jgi:hypothetical protein